MKNILVVNDFPLYPPDHGGKVRLYNIYREIAKRHNVRYLCFTDGWKTETVELGDRFTMIRVPKGLVHWCALRLSSLLSAVSIDDLIAMAFCGSNGKLTATLEGLVDGADVVVLSHPYMYPAVQKLASGKKIVYEAHNVEYLLKKQIVGSGIVRDYLLRRTREVEGSLATRADLVFATSSDDAEKLGAMYGVEEKKLRVAPNGADLSIFGPSGRWETGEKSGALARPLAVFVGSAHPPNVEAAKVLIREIAPRVPDVDFLLCGSVCYGVKDEKRGRNVGLAYLITDEEKAELFSFAAIAVNPMQGGSGTNLKMLDYMAAGLPVVATPAGARGLGLEDGVHAIICAPAEFPEMLGRVLRDGDLYARLSRSGRKKVEEEFRWEKIARDMENALLSL